ncbi:HEPN domain-containing protein [Ferroplasma sp.]|uniref:HEPN domain-containing protein n=1 Tax=Ferroplasma sp. TaxID=2591003 RepID=UPI00262B72D8|nr:HEPN domain-containing protein [Ferroplasma sp.]
MSFSEAQILKKRSSDFLEESKYLIDIKKYDLAIFNMEQYCELILQYEMLTKLGYYPGTHSLKELINKLSDVDNSLKNLVTDEMNLLYLGRLSDAYISTRYMPVEFDEVETKNIYRFVVEVFKKYVDKF